MTPRAVSSMLVACGLLFFSAEPATPAGSLQPVDRIVVRKSERRMRLFRQDEVVSTYRVALGLNPIGHKLHEGDFRTPEGRYHLSRRNSNSEFFLSIQISYPNEQDRARARRIKQQPGGAIMIHGLPNRPRHPPEYYEKRDWTDGCIAVTNSEMVEIWMLTGRETPIEIVP